MALDHKDLKDLKKFLKIIDDFNLQLFDWIKPLALTNTYAEVLDLKALVEDKITELEGDNNEKS